MILWLNKIHWTHYVWIMDASSRKLSYKTETSSPQCLSLVNGAISVCPTREAGEKKQFPFFFPLGGNFEWFLSFRLNTVLTWKSPEGLDSLTLQLESSDLRSHRRRVSASFSPLQSLRPGYPAGLFKIFVIKSLQIPFQILRPPQLKIATYTYTTNICRKIWNP